MARLASYESSKVRKVWYSSDEVGGEERQKSVTEVIVIVIVIVIMIYDFMIFIIIIGKCQTTASLVSQVLIDIVRRRTVNSRYRQIRCNK